MAFWSCGVTDSPAVAAVPGARARRARARCGGQHGGGDRSEWGSGDTSLGPWPGAVEGRREPAVPGATVGAGRMPHVCAVAVAVAVELWGTQASLHVLGEGRAPVGGNGNEKYFGDCWQRTWASPSLLLVFFVVLVVVGFSFFFLFSPPPLSVLPCFLAARLPFSWATPVPHVEWDHCFPGVATAAGRRGPGAVTPFWARAGQSEMTLQPQPGPFVQAHCNLGLKSCASISIRPIVKKNNNKQKTNCSSWPPLFFSEQAQAAITQRLII